MEGEVREGEMEEGFGWEEEEEVVGEVVVVVVLAMVIVGGGAGSAVMVDIVGIEEQASFDGQFIFVKSSAYSGVVVMLH